MNKHMGPESAVWPADFAQYLNWAEILRKFQIEDRCSLPDK